MRQVARRTLLPILFLAGLLGCGKSESTTAAIGPLGSAELTELLQGQGSQNDPRRQAEVLIGEFHITHDTPVEFELVTIRFKLFAVVPQTKQDETSKLVTQWQQRMRDSIIRVVKETDYQSLHDPTLAHLKSEISLMVNQTIRRNHVRGVVFSDYAIDKG